MYKNVFDEVARNPGKTPKEILEKFASDIPNFKLNGISFDGLGASDLKNVNNAKNLSSAFNIALYRTFNGIANPEYI